ncbi:MAG: SusC/RagA family TonB-linked outer membrane protein, partial [Muribaculaceae bacterium]
HFLPELHFNLNLGYQVSKNEALSTTAENSVQAWSNNSLIKMGAYGAGTYYKWYELQRNTLLDFYINYRKEFEAIKSNVDATVGYSWQRFSYLGHSNTYLGTLGFNNYTYADGAYNLVRNEGAAVGSDGQSWNVGDPVLNAPMSRWSNPLQLISFFGRLNYTFDNTYLLTFTLRDDATSRFHKDNRWGLFPSAAFAWNIAEEKFIKENDNTPISSLKLRLGWGRTGQQDIGSTCNYLPLYQYSQAGSYYPVVDTNGNVVYAQTLYLMGYNPDLKWEETTTWNAGFDFGFLNNRITASLDYYFRKTKDLLSYVPIAVGSSTVNMLNKNIGSLENQGVEFSINARPVVTKDFTWTVNYNIAWNRNRITELNDNAAVINVGGISGGTGNTVQAHKVGYPAFSYLLYEQVYDENGLPIEGEFVDQDGNGEINEGDKVIRHSKDPKITMTFGTTFNWKNWDFGFNLRANIGNYVYNDALSTHTTLSDTYKNTNLTNLIRNNFYFEGGGSHNNYMSDYWLRNASFVRCDNITLGYTWNNLLNDQLRLRLYGAVQNPFVFTKYNGLDPEVESGIDNSVYPRPITVSFGLVATF